MWWIVKKETEKKGKKHLPASIRGQCLPENETTLTGCGIFNLVLREHLKLYHW